MNAKNMKTEYNLKQWQLIIQDCHNSGMKVNDWCKQNDVNRNSYYYWYRRVRDAACEALAENKVTVSSSFAPIPMNVIESIDNGYQGNLTISIGKAKIEVTENTSPDILRMVLEVLSNA